MGYWYILDAQTYYYEFSNKCCYVNRNINTIQVYIYIYKSSNTEILKVYEIQPSLLGFGGNVYKNWNNGVTADMV